MSGQNTGHNLPWVGIILGMGMGCVGWHCTKDERVGGHCLRQHCCKTAHLSFLSKKYNDFYHEDNDGEEDADDDMYHYGDCMNCE